MNIEFIIFSITLTTILFLWFVRAIIIAFSILAPLLSFIAYMGRWVVDIVKGDA